MTSYNTTATDELTHMRGRIAELEQQAAHDRRTLDELQRMVAQLRVFKTLAENTTDAIAITDLDGVLTYTNSAHARISGVSNGVGTRIADYLDTAEYERVAAEVIPVIQQQGEWFGTITYRRPDGSVWIGESSNFLITDDAGLPTGMAGIFRDVTESRRREAALRDSEARNRALIEAMPDLLFTLSRAGVYLNTRAEQCDLLVAPPDALQGRTIDEMLPPDVAARLHTLIETACTTQATQEFEYTLDLPDGSHTFEGRMAAIGKDAVLLICRDITEQQRSERERLALQERVIEVQQAALRELSTPLIPIGEGIVAMPLIGSIDSQRAQQVMETLLEGVTAQNATTTILDITGVPVVDTQVANVLLRAAQAVKLLGAQVILTGIRPEIAQTLVGLGVDMRGITTRSTLQTAIAEALRH